MNPYAEIKAYERRAYTQLTDYLKRLDAGGWSEQSYCSDWLVYQVVSHIGSGSRIGALRVRAWTADGPAVTREVMQGIWGRFDSLGPSDIFGEYEKAAAEYLEAEASTPDAAGEQEVDGFAGRRPLWAYQLARTWELACHSWDVFVARDHAARLDADAVRLLAGGFQVINLPLDRERGGALALKPVTLRLLDSGVEYTLDPAAERPRVAAGSADAAPLVVEGPDEEVIRFLSGRGFLPGAPMRLRVVKGSPGDLGALRRAFR